MTRMEINDKIYQCMRELEDVEKELKLRTMQEDYYSTRIEDEVDLRKVSIAHQVLEF